MSLYESDGTTWVRVGGGTGPAGPTGPTGPAGATGAPGPAGPGVPTGGTTGQALVKTSGTDYDTHWATSAGAVAKLYDYTVTGSDKASIDTQVDDGGNGAAALPGSYAVLEIFIVARTDQSGVSADFQMTLNNDSGPYYDRQVLVGTGSTPTSVGVISMTAWPINAHAAGGTGTGYPGFAKILIPAYAGTTFWKVAEVACGNNDTTVGSQLAALETMGYRGSAAITRVKIAPGGANVFKVATRMIIYGRV